MVGTAETRSAGKGSARVVFTLAPVTLALFTLALLTLGLVGCTDDSGSQAAFCRQVSSVPPLDSLLTGFGDANPGELENRLDSATTAYGRLRSAAPSEIRADVKTMVDLVDAIIEAVRKHADDPEAAAGQLRKSMTEHAGAAEASAQVATYASERCQVQLNPTLDDGSSTTTSPAASPTASTAVSPTTTVAG